MAKSGNTTVPSQRRPNEAGDEARRIVVVLVLVWSAAEPHRFGELAFVPTTGAGVLGREGLSLYRLRPGVRTPTGPLVDINVSRAQLRVSQGRNGIDIENVGRCGLTVNAVSTERATVRPGDVVEINGHYSFLVCARASSIPDSEFPGNADHPFGHADALGMVGESDAAWAAREALIDAADSPCHVLLTGESGTGKEACAKGIHMLSSRASGPFLADNAANFTEGLAASELFGNRRNYPNPPAEESEGLVGAAEGGTLFLDEIGEMSHELQAHLMRVLDPAGGYRRLGERKTRRANVRVVCATNRAVSALKHDLAARLKVKVRLPSLSERREDIPLIARHLVLKMARDGEKKAQRFVTEDGTQVRFDQAFVRWLLQRKYPGNVRDLEALLREAINVRGATTLQIPANPNPVLPVEAGDSSEAAESDGNEPSVETIAAALKRNRGDLQRTADELRLSRHQLYRLRKRPRTG
jgi:two-component system nitrogen regulation response regulator GlnG/two-component system response regulator HydG